MVVEWTPPEDVTEAEMWDLTTKGVRVMEVMTDEATSVANLLETVLMFIPEFTHEVGPIAARKNVDFMTRYPQVCFCLFFLVTTFGYGIVALCNSLICCLVSNV